MHLFPRSTTVPHDLVLFVCRYSMATYRKLTSSGIWDWNEKTV